MDSPNAPFDALPMKGEYRTIVADPPWPYPDDKRGWGIGVGKNSWLNDRTRAPKPYPPMTIEAISSLPVKSLIGSAAHLYLWTTNRHLPEAFHVAKAWGFRYAQTLVWVKMPRGSFLGGAYGPNTEFVLFCRRGSLATTSRRNTSWFDFPRVGSGSHSRKPEGLQDIVERVSPGPYLELFARRKRVGWHAWGDELNSDIETAA